MNPRETCFSLQKSHLEEEIDSDAAKGLAFQKEMSHSSS